jgi:hypothetical protein
MYGRFRTGLPLKTDLHRISFPARPPTHDRRATTLQIAHTTPVTLLEVTFVRLYTPAVCLESL